MHADNLYPMKTVRVWKNPVYTLSTLNTTIIYSNAIDWCPHVKRNVRGNIYVCVANVGYSYIFRKPCARALGVIGVIVMQLCVFCLNVAMWTVTCEVPSCFRLIFFYKLTENQIPARNTTKLRMMYFKTATSDVSCYVIDTTSYTTSLL